MQFHLLLSFFHALLLPLFFFHPCLSFTFSKCGFFPEFFIYLPSSFRRICSLLFFPSSNTSTLSPSFSPHFHPLPLTLPRFLLPFISFVSHFFSLCANIRRSLFVFSELRIVLLLLFSVFISSPPLLLPVLSIFLSSFFSSVSSIFTFFKFFLIKKFCFMHLC